MKTKLLLSACLVPALFAGGCGRSPMDGLARVGAAGSAGHTGVGTGGGGGERPATGGQGGRGATGGATGGGGIFATGGQGGFVPTGGASGVGGSSASGGMPYALQGDLVQLASGQPRPLWIAIDGTSVYWANSDTAVRGAILKAPLGGGAATPLLTRGTPGGIAVDNTNVYWSGYSPDGDGTTALWKIPLAGGETTKLATGFMNDPIAVGPDGVYGTGSVDGGVTIVSAPLAGGATTALVPASSLRQTFASYGIAVDATSVYWVTFSDPSTVMKVPLGGGSPTTLGSAPGGGFGLALDATSAYWISAKAVTKVGLQGGTPTTLAATGGQGTQGIAVDDTHVYWSDGGSPGSVYKVPIQGGATMLLATNLQHPTGVAVDATSVYWVNAGDGGATGSVMKLTPK